MERLNTGTVMAGVGQTLWWPFYDKITLDAATLVHTLFAVPAGQDNKTIADTNMTGSGGEMPQGQKHEAVALEMYYVSDGAKTAAELQNVLDMFTTTYREFTILNKSPQLQIPLTLLMGSKLTQHVTGGAAGDQLIGQSIFPGVFELEIPIILAEKTSFDVKITHTTAHKASLDGDQIYVALPGKLITN